MTWHALRWFVEQMQPYPEAIILVQGFADATGGDALNEDLSRDRAQAVAGYLALQGIDGERDLHRQVAGVVAVADARGHGEVAQAVGPVEGADEVLDAAAVLAELSTHGLLAGGGRIQIAAHRVDRVVGLNRKVPCRIVELGSRTRRARILQRYPRLRRATMVECEIKQNEMLFLPAGWFHEVSSGG